MSGGLLALLDDIAVIAKLAAASLDDAAAQAAKAGVKAAGILIDDAAVTPRYVVGFAADRELPIIAKIAWGSLKNKIFFLLPGALALSVFAPWAITPLLMLGGLYLAFEGYEKVTEWITGSDKAHGTKAAAAPSLTGQALEDSKVQGAIRTDLILSAEIMAIALSTVATASFLTKAMSLAIVGIMITVLVYGVVALIVKADDAGLALARQSSSSAQALGRGIVATMPKVLTALSVIGTVAMLWVGGGIVLHGLAEYGLKGPEYGLKAFGDAIGSAIPVIGGLVSWLVNATGAAIVGYILGWPVAKTVGKYLH